MTKSQLSWVWIPSFSDTVGSERRQMKQCWIKYQKKIKKILPLWIFLGAWVCWPLLCYAEYWSHIVLNVILYSILTTDLYGSGQSIFAMFHLHYRYIFNTHASKLRYFICPFPIRAFPFTCDNRLETTPQHFLNWISDTLWKEGRTFCLNVGSTAMISVFR